MCTRVCSCQWVAVVTDTTAEALVVVAVAVAVVAVDLVVVVGSVVMVVVGTILIAAAVAVDGLAAVLGESLLKHLVLTSISELLS